ncbi:AsmA family protein [Enhydrobacter aerosaccus]|uniref:AsmA family protein n=1 Tax=Enhydrobacter aerosaccus TaxID=225324 RepID=A0A1T4LL99_9HYPH|nr:AsmA family protein [Enhydrobacter aerosaccus]SJZ55502.1 AsmA family protein [Enhydrobacter aerosaccus]
MTRTAKVVSWSVGILAALIGLSAAGAYLFVTSDFVHRQFESRASALSGRKTTIGKIGIDWGWTSHVHLADVQVANADWGKADHMLKAQAVDFDIRLWPLLRGDFVLPRLTLLKPELHMERNQQDQANWSPEQSPVVAGVAKAAAPKERHQTPLIAELDITDGQVTYSDLKRKIDLEGTISTATGQAGGQPEARLQLKGKLENQPLAVNFVGGSAVMLRQTDKPYPVDLDIDYGATKLAIKGTLQDPIQWKGGQCAACPVGPEPRRYLPVARHSRSSDAALSHHWSPRSRAWQMEGDRFDLACGRQ